LFSFREGKKGRARRAAGERWRDLREGGAGEEG
jgi:hypothetical protein